MSSQNPGISAAGRALGRTALNPASGPAAIGGMLQAGNVEDDAWDVDPSGTRTRLTKAVSDITKLANALEALAVTASPETDATDRDGALPAIGGYLSERVDRQEAS